MGRGGRFTRGLRIDTFGKLHCLAMDQLGSDWGRKRSVARVVFLRQHSRRSLQDSFISLISRDPRCAWLTDPG